MQVPKFAYARIRGSPEGPRPGRRNHRKPRALGERAAAERASDGIARALKRGWPWTPKSPAGEVLSPTGGQKTAAARAAPASPTPPAARESEIGARGRRRTATAGESCDGGIGRAKSELCIGPLRAGRLPQQPAQSGCNGIKRACSGHGAHAGGGTRFEAERAATHQKWPAMMLFARPNPVPRSARLLAAR